MISTGRLDNDGETTYTFFHDDDHVVVTEKEIVDAYMQWWEARKVAAEQRDEDGECYVLFEPEFISEAGSCSSSDRRWKR